jgi:hypothetical protein
MKSGPLAPVRRGPASAPPGLSTRYYGAAFIGPPRDRVGIAAPERQRLIAELVPSELAQLAAEARSAIVAMGGLPRLSSSLGPRLWAHPPCAGFCF